MAFQIGQHVYVTGRVSDEVGREFGIMRAIIRTLAEDRASIEIPPTRALQPVKRKFLHATRDEAINALILELQGGINELKSNIAWLELERDPQ